MDLSEWLIAVKGVRRILKRGVTYRKGSTSGGGGGGGGECAPLPREARKPSGAEPFEDIISLRNQQDSTCS